MIDRCNDHFQSISSFPHFSISSFPVPPFISTPFVQTVLVNYTSTGEEKTLGVHRRVYFVACVYVRGECRHRYFRLRNRSVEYNIWCGNVAKEFFFSVLNSKRSSLCVCCAVCLAYSNH